MMRWMLILICAPFPAFCQSDYIPFAEADKSIARLENEERVYDSLRKVQSRKVVLNVFYGQRGIANRNRATGPDTLTFTDFTSRRSFYGIGVGYFVKPKLYIAAELSFLLLPREQEVSSVSFGANGITAEGRGNGGGETSIRLITQYFLKQDQFTRPYLRLAFGRVNLFAKGGDVSLSGGSRSGDVNELNASLGSLQLAAGINHRASPGIALDCYLGYMMTSEAASLGGIVSAGGWNTALTLQIILNPKKRLKQK